MIKAMNKYKLSDIANVELSGVDKKSAEGETPVLLCNFTSVRDKRSKK